MQGRKAVGSRFGMAKLPKRVSEALMPVFYIGDGFLYLGDSMKLYLKHVALAFLLLFSFLSMVEAAPAPPEVTGPKFTSESRPTWSWTSGGGGNGTFRYHEDTDDFSGSYTTTTDTSVTAQSDLPPGSYTLYVQESDFAGNWSASGFFTVVVEEASFPMAPVVTGPATTNNPRPTWSWTSGGGGNGTFRYHEDTDDFSGSYTTTTDTSVTAQSDLPPGSYTLYVQESDFAGNWSSSGGFTLLIIGLDSDNDGIFDTQDNCPAIVNADQADADADGEGDACDNSDTDSDGLTDAEEFVLETDPTNPDTDGDGVLDGNEVNCASNPLDPESKCNRGMPWLMLLLEDE